MSSRQPWSQTEDEILTSLVKKYGVGNWVLISQKMETRANANTRSGKQCRERWHNHLDPSVTKKSWTLHQQKIMFDAHKKFGNKWSDIANQLHGRTDSDVKNHFYSIIRKCLRRVSKMVGQKNSTERIRNVKPSLLSKLLQNRDDPKSKQTSQALFKFILQRQNLSLENLEKKNKQILQNLVEKIVNMSQEKDSRVKSFLSSSPSEEEQKKAGRPKKRVERKSLRNLRSIQDLHSEKQKSQQPLPTKVPRKLSPTRNKTKTIKKENVIQPGSKRQSKVETVYKENNHSQEYRFAEFDIHFSRVNSIIKQESFLGELQHYDSFRPFDDGYSTKSKQFSKGNSLSKESVSSQRGFLNEIMLPDLVPMKRRSSAGSYQNKRMMSDTDNNIGFCVTPPMPTPGYGGNLFPTFKINPCVLTIQELNSQVNGLKKQIQRNNLQKQY